MKQSTAKTIAKAVFWLLWAGNTYSGNGTEAAIYLVGFIVLIFLPEDRS